MSRSMALVLVLLVLFLTSQSEWKPPRNQPGTSGGELDEKPPLPHMIPEDIILELTAENHRLKKLVEALETQLDECKKSGLPSSMMLSGAEIQRMEEGGYEGKAQERMEWKVKTQVMDDVNLGSERRVKDVQGIKDSSGNGAKEEMKGGDGAQGDGSRVETGVGRTEGDGMTYADDENVRGRRKATEQNGGQAAEVMGSSEGVEEKAASRQVPLDMLEQAMDWVVPRVALRPGPIVQLRPPRVDIREPEMAEGLKPPLTQRRGEEGGALFVSDQNGGPNRNIVGGGNLVQEGGSGWLEGTYADGQQKPPQARRR